MILRKDSNFEQNSMPDPNCMFPNAPVKGKKAKKTDTVCIYIGILVNDYPLKI